MKTKKIEEITFDEDEFLKKLGLKGTIRNIEFSNLGRGEIILELQKG